MLTFFFFNDTATTEIYTLSLHDALPISFLPRALERVADVQPHAADPVDLEVDDLEIHGDRKSTRLNSSHVRISYAVFCLKKKKNNDIYSCSCLYTYAFLVLAAVTLYDYS